MRRRLWTLGIFLLIVAVGSIGLTGCSRQAQVREEQTSEQPTTLAEMIPESENMVPMPGETVVSAVSPTPAPNTPDAGEQSASSSAAEQSQSPTPEPVVPIEPAADPTETATAAANTAATAAETAPTAQASDSNGAGQTIVHRVRKGETLSGIAQRYGTTTKAIRKANDISDPSLIIPGQMLTIQASGDSETSSCRKEHTVKKDEWVWQIAEQYDVKPKEILAANNLTSKQAETLQPGTVLCIP